jgi:cytochrome bd-type quinol oxidase subunit 2
MIKNIGSAILGYIVIFATIFITFTIAYLILGTEGAFQERTYDVSFAWIVVSIILSIVRSSFRRICLQTRRKK